MDFGEVGPLKGLKRLVSLEVKECYHLCLLIVLDVGGFYVRNLCF